MTNSGVSTYTSLLSRAWSRYTRDLPSRSVIQAWRYHVHTLQAGYELVDRQLSNGRNGHKEVVMLCCSGVITGRPRR